MSRHVAKICMFVIAFDSLFLRPKATLTWKMKNREVGKWSFK